MKENARFIVVVLCVYVVQIREDNLIQVSFILCVCVCVFVHFSFLKENKRNDVYGFERTRNKKIFEDANVELSEENDVAECRNKERNLFILFFY